MGELKIEHLLTMTTGHDTDTTRFVVSEKFLRHRSELRVGDRDDRNDLRGFFELPITHAPGTHFVYNSGASHVLGEILQRRIGVPLEQYLQSRLFEPLGIRSPQWERTRHGAYRGDGAFGQFCLVMPRQAAVIAINGGLHDMQAVLNAIWSHLLPAMAERTLPINPYAYGQLAQELAMLELGPSQAANRSSMHSDYKWYTIHNPATGLSKVSIDFQDDGCRFEWHNDSDAHFLDSGYREWRVTNPLDGKKIAEKGIWQDEHTFMLTAYELDSPHHDILTFYFEGKLLRLRHEHLIIAELRHELIGTAVEA